MFTCIRCYRQLSIAPRTPDERVVVCPDCDFRVTAGDLRFIVRALGEAEGDGTAEVPEWLTNLLDDLFAAPSA